MPSLKVERDLEECQMSSLEVQGTQVETWNNCQECQASGQSTGGERLGTTAPRTPHESNSSRGLGISQVQRRQALSQCQRSVHAAPASAPVVKPTVGPKSHRWRLTTERIPEWPTVVEDAGFGAEEETLEVCLLTSAVSYNKCLDPNDQRQFNQTLCFWYLPQDL